MNTLEIQVLASSSSGNAYLIGDGKTKLLIECGIPWKEIQKKIDFILPDACLISHAHGDHVKSWWDVARLGIPCYMSRETYDDLSNPKTPFCLMLKHKNYQQIGTFKVLPVEMEHDAYCLGFYIYSQYSKETLFFATDTCVIPYKFDGLDYIMVEANYDIDILNKRIMEGHIDPAMKNRLARSHMEIGTTVKWLEQQNLSKTKRIYLLHLSYGSSNADEFKRRVEECTGVPCTIA